MMITKLDLSQREVENGWCLQHYKCKNDIYITKKIIIIYFNLEKSVDLPLFM